MEQGTYRRSITRRHRTAILFLLDQSGSMAEKVHFDGREVTKAEAVAEITNRLLFELTERARRGEEVRDYYDIAVITYSGGGARSALGGEGEFVSVTELSERSVEQSVWHTEHTLPDGSHTMIRTAVPRHVAPSASGTTPMYEAMEEAFAMMEEWCSREPNADSFPPIAINITDGEFSDCTEEEIVDLSRKIRSLGTTDGNVLLLNIHLSSGNDRPTIFPTAGEIPQAGRNAELLARCSSVMPAAFDSVIGRYRGDGRRPPFIGMSYNAPIAELFNIVNIGSISVNNTV